MATRGFATRSGKVMFRAPRGDPLDPRSLLVAFDAYRASALRLEIVMMNHPGLIEREGNVERHMPAGLQGELTFPL